MCIAVFIWKSHPLYPFLLLSNRDEYHNRPTTPLGWWEDSKILGGRDGEAGGTWLACTTDGKLSFLTNVREISSNSSLVKSRGELPIRFLKVFLLRFTMNFRLMNIFEGDTATNGICALNINQGTKSPKEFAEELEGEADQFKGFNLIVADLFSKTMLYITNRPKDSHGLSVAEAQRLRRSFKVAVEKCFDAEISLKGISEVLMNDTSKDDESELPGIYTPDFEYHLSAIFVEADSPLGRYGTRSTSALVVRTEGGRVKVSFYERNLENDVWKEQTMSFYVECEKVGA
ncbi:transport and golgi organization 2 homolog [Phtheirospermum japonicum]|uniref:Transport and golgi organization 2 homolog n=1 Tax=Phtheirospermum japonicum TaxID=374723 RepID=A0A830BSI1_9LAMI|nr:transport and golgi organization 2 homolog [Phtheirospermum japonicum]